MEKVRLLRGVNTRQVQVLILKVAADATESAKRLLDAPPDHARAIVAMREDVVAGGEAVRRARLFHFVKLLEIEFVMAHRAPVISGLVHRETGSERAVSADNQVILPGTARP